MQSSVTMVWRVSWSGSVFSVDGIYGAMNKDTVKEALRFCIVGAVATAIHYGVYFLLQFSLDVNAAYTAGYVVSFIFNYILSARFTFRKKTSVKNGIGFGGAHLVNYFLQVSLLNIFLWLGISRPLAPVPVYCIAIPVNFLMVRFVFVRKR